MRLFIAVWPNDEMKKAMISVMHEMKKQGITGNYVPTQNLHMTLVFLGEVKEAEKVKNVMDQIPVEKAGLSFSDYGNFGDAFWIGIKTNQKMKKYVSDLKKALKEQGIPCSDEKFSPHITLIRQQKGKKPSGLVIPDTSMTVNKIVLLKSEIKDKKTLYKEIYAV